MRRPRRPPLRGSTLIEALLALALFAVGIAATLTAYSTSMGISEHQSHMSTALLVGEQTMEELILRYRSDPEIAVGTHNGPGFARDGTRSSGATSAFQVSWVVSAGPLDSKKIEVFVRWTEKVLADRVLVLKTYRS